MMLLMQCIHETIPNPHTVRNLTQEQIEVLEIYTEGKCQQRIIEFFPNPNLKLGEQLGGDRT